MKAQFIYIGKKDNMGEMPWEVLGQSLDNFGQLSAESYGNEVQIEGPEEVIAQWAEENKMNFKK